MSNKWLQSRIFTCPMPTCSATYTHDRAYQHELFQCPMRNEKAVERGQAKEDLCRLSH